MLNLKNVQINSDLPELSDVILMEIGKVFDGDVVEILSEVEPEAASCRVSLVDMVVLMAIIMFITSGSSKFMISDTVSNYFVLNALHAVVIAIVFYVYVRLT
jgi:hypothetical protein